MKKLKQILAYLIWIVLALLSGIGYMRIVLGPNTDSSKGGLFHVFGNLIYEFALVHVGLRIGGVIALLYILSDIFYLKKKLENNVKSTIIRFLFLLGIATVVGVTHYILEKVVDII